MRQRVIDFQQKAFERWNQFWFQSEDLRGLSIARILLAGTLFYLYLQRHFHLDTFFSEQGIVPKSLALGLYPDFYRPPFLLAFFSDAWLPWVHGFFVLSLLLMALGLSNRFWMFLTWVIGLSFLQRNYSIAFGADVIGHLFLGYLSLTNCCEKLTLKSKIWTQQSSGDLSQSVSSLFMRLMQVQLCVIYAYTGFEKLKGVTWWDGTALWTVFANTQMVLFDMSWTRHFPWLIVLLTFLTVLFEIYFPVLIWLRKVKWFVLLFGVFFHIGIGVVMALMPFALVMLAPYALFLTAEDKNFLLSQFKKRDAS